MNDSRLFKALQAELALPLPGRTYQLKLAADSRKTDQLKATGRTDHAAVSLIICVEEEKDPELVLIKRTEYPGPHSGQVSFPGGKKDAVDPSLLATAVRETKEEIGIGLDAAECIGRLTPLDIQVSGFRVHPFVFYIDRVLNFTPDPEEVDYTIRFPIGILLDETLIKTHTFQYGPICFEAPYFAIQDEIVWGATAMILAEFREILARMAKKDEGVLGIPGDF